MNKNVLFGKEARDKVLSGVNKISAAIKVTLGPMGKCVLISRAEMIDYGVYNLPIHVSKDGYTVSRSFKLTDPMENVGVMLIQEAAKKTVDMAGDGTTCTSILAEALIQGGMKLIDEGANSQELKKGIDVAVDYVVKELKKIAIPVGTDLEKIRHVASIAANNDSSIGDLIAEAFKKIGNEGVIDIEEAKSVNTEIKVTDGFKFDKGWLRPMFVTNQGKNTCELNDPYILLYDKNITTMKQIVPILNQVASESKPIVFICDDIDGEALAFLVVNNAQRKLSTCIISSPFLGDKKRELMEDLAVVTGATFISDLKGIGIESVKLEHLGKAKKIIISKDDTVIISGEKNKHEFDDLYNNLKMNSVQAESDQEKEMIENRIARLTGSIAIISVGAPTEIEMKEKKDRVDDSIRATKSAIAEGIVAGGGISFLQAIKTVSSGEYNKNKLGFDLVLKALEVPLRQICINAGADETEILKQVADLGDDIGYNAKTGAIENLIESGVIDPVKVLRCSLQNASSVAGMILTTECLIVDSIN